MDVPRELLTVLSMMDDEQRGRMWQEVPPQLREQVYLAGGLVAGPSIARTLATAACDSAVIAFGGIVAKESEELKRDLANGAEVRGAALVNEMPDLVADSRAAMREILDDGGVPFDTSMIVTLLGDMVLTGIVGLSLALDRPASEVLEELTAGQLLDEGDQEAEARERFRAEVEIRQALRRSEAGIEDDDDPRNQAGDYL